MAGILQTRINNAHKAAALVAEGFTLPQACKKLGYKDYQKQSQMFSADPKYQALVTDLRAENAEMSKLKRQDIQDIVMEAIGMARVGDDPMTMIRGAQELNKMCGFYAPEEKKFSLNVSQRRIQERFDSLSDHDLLELASRTEEVVIEDAQIIEIDEDRPDVDD